MSGGEWKRVEREKRTSMILALWETKRKKGEIRGELCQATDCRGEDRIEEVEDEPDPVALKKRREADGGSPVLRKERWREEGRKKRDSSNSPE